MKRKFWNWVRNEGERILFLNGEISDETWYGDEVTHKCELKQAILVKLLYETRYSGFFGTVFSLTDNGNIFYLQNE